MICRICSIVAYGTITVGTRYSVQGCFSVCWNALNVPDPDPGGPKTYGSGCGSRTPLSFWTGEVRWDLRPPTTSGEGARARTAREDTGTRTTRRAAAAPGECAVPTGVAALRGEEVRLGAAGGTEATAAPGESEGYIKRMMELCLDSLCENCITFIINCTAILKEFLTLNITDSTVKT
jgi:hypothetical protein